jgi:Ala-tRNA(Pro) deacylase
MLSDYLTHELDRKHFDYELISHRRTLTAGDEAAAIGVPSEEVAKTVVMKTSSGYVRAVLPASERLDLHKVQDLLANDHTARLATEAELAAAYPMFELGAVPPFGGPAGDRLLVDRHLTECESVVLEAGTHDSSVRIKTRDLLTLTGAEIADLAE